jgi:hypothetical protein
LSSSKTAATAATSSGVNMTLVVAQQAAEQTARDGGSF